LIASLLAVHGGAIFAISGLKGSVKPEQLPGLIDGAAFNLAGIFLTLLAGFCAWLNFQFAQILYMEWQKPEMLYRSDGFPKDKKGTRKIGASMYAAAAFGIAASLCFVASSYLVISSLRRGQIEGIKPQPGSALVPGMPLNLLPVEANHNPPPTSER
jgi:hypothetical protein